MSHRSIELPKRDEAKEIERRLRARKARESRRSTQVGAPPATFCLPVVILGSPMASFDAKTDLKPIIIIIILLLF